MGHCRLSETVDRARHPSLHAFLEWGIDMQLGDIRELLLLPRPDLGMEHGQNFTAAAALSNFIAGVSVWLFEASEDALRNRRDRSRRYRSVLEQYWPWDREVVDRDVCIDVLYIYARNPLAHSFGMPDPEAGILIELAKRPLSEDEICELEQAEERPEWLGPTIIPSPRAASGHAYFISVPALYWGVQRLCRAVLADGAQADRAEQLARTLVTYLTDPNSPWRKGV